MEESRSRQLTLAGSALAFAGAAGAAGLTAATEPRVLQISAGALVAELFLLSIALGGAWATRRPTLDALGWVPSRLSPAAVALLALATLGASHTLDSVLSLLELRGQGTLGVLAEALVGAQSFELAAALVTLGLLPALVEELLCRGFLQRSLLRRFRPGLAIAGSSLFFAVLHGEPMHAALSAPLGVHLGLVAWWGGSTRPAVLCHAANNVGAVLLGVLALDLPGSPWLHLGLGLVVAGAGWAAALSVERRR